MECQWPSPTLTSEMKIETDGMAKLAQKRAMIQLPIHVRNQKEKQQKSK